MIGGVPVLVNSKVTLIVAPAPNEPEFPIGAPDGRRKVGEAAGNIQRNASSAANLFGVLFIPVVELSSQRAPTAIVSPLIATDSPNLSLPCDIPSLKAMGLQPKRTSAPILDHVIALNEHHRHRLIGDYVNYYHEVHVHDSLEKDTPKRRPVEQKC